MSINEVTPLIWITVLGIAICTRMIFDLIVFVYQCTTMPDNYMEQKKYNIRRITSFYSLMVSFLFVAVYLCILLVVACINPKLQ